MKLLLIFFVIVAGATLMVSCPKKEKIIPDPMPPEPKVEATRAPN